MFHYCFIFSHLFASNHSHSSWRWSFFFCSEPVPYLAPWELGPWQMKVDVCPVQTLRRTTKHIDSNRMSLFYGIIQFYNSWNKFKTFGNIARRGSMVPFFIFNYFFKGCFIFGCEKYQALSEDFRSISNCSWAGVINSKVILNTFETTGIFNRHFCYQHY